MKTSLSIIAILSCVLLLTGCGADLTSEQEAQKFVSKNGEFCNEEPTEGKRGKKMFPIIPQYEQLSALGQLFTANHCGAERLEQLDTVTDGMYTAGSIIWLSEAPSGDLLTTLKEIGFECSGGAEGNCKKWRLTTESIAVAEMTKLEPLSAEIASDDCFHCK